MSFVCKPCFYKTVNKYNLDRHMLTEKHLKVIQGLSKGSDERKCPTCDKYFRHSSSYYRHRKVCSEWYTDDIEEYNDEMINFSELIELRHENEKLKMEMKYQTELAEKDVKILNTEKEKATLEAEFQKALLDQHRDLTCDTIKSTGSSTVQGIININGSNNTLMSKKDHMNFYFGETLDFETFIENFRTKYPLTSEQTRILAENYRESGIKSYAPGLFCYLKKNYCQQIKDLTGEEPDEDFIMPFVSSDSALRSHLEKTTEGWKTINNMDQMNRIIIVSNDYIYSHHNTYLPIGVAERKQIGNAILRKSTFTDAETIAKKKHQKIKMLQEQKILYPCLEKIK